MLFAIALSILSVSRFTWNEMPTRDHDYTYLDWNWDIKVTKTNGTEIKCRYAELKGDTLICVLGSRLHIPKHEVAKIEYRIHEEGAECDYPDDDAC